MLRTAGVLVVVAAMGLAQEKSTVSGTVASLSGQPLKGATVRLFRAPTGGEAEEPRAYVVSSDGQGNFAFDGPKPGRYGLMADRAGYLTLEYSTNSKSKITLLDLTSARQLTDIALKLTPQAVIAGRITNEDGEPFPGVQVDLMRWTYAGGRKLLQAAGGAVSDADGMYSIGSLEPGSYRVVAAAPGLNRFFEAPADGLKEIHVTTYYPAATDPSRAIPIQVGPGAVARGMDIRMRKASVYSVRGIVIDSVSRNPPQVATLGLYPNDTGRSNVAPGNYRNGLFEFKSVLPGEYVLEVMEQPRNGIPGSVARQFVRVGNGDVDGLVVRLDRGAQLAGTLAIEGASAAPVFEGGGRHVINLNGTAEGIPNMVAEVNPDGSFAFQQVLPGRYRVMSNQLPPGLWLKTVRVSGQVVTGRTFEVSSGRNGTVEVLLSPNAAEVRGVLRDTSADGAGQPLSGVVVSLWKPGPPAEGTADFVLVDETGPDGEFEFTSLAPGEYRVAAWEGMEQGLATIPEFRNQFDDQAVKITVKEGDHAQVEPPLIPHDRIEAEASKLP